MVANRKNKNLASLIVRSKVVGHAPSRLLVNSRPPCIDPMPVVTPNVVHLFTNTITQ